MKYEIPQMLKQGGGTIVNTASIAGLLGFSDAPAYVAAKHGAWSDSHGRPHSNTRRKTSASTAYALA